jgi:hypothetical protein
MNKPPCVVFIVIHGDWTLRVGSLRCSDMSGVGRKAEVLAALVK